MSCEACRLIYTLQPQVQPTGWSRDDDTYVQTHHEDISGLCRAALGGCRTCTDLWGHFFRTKTPEEYAEQPYFVTNGIFIHAYQHSGTQYRFLDPGEVLDASIVPGTYVVEFSLNSPVANGAENKRVAFQSFDADDELEDTMYVKTPSRVISTGLQHGMRVVAPSKHVQVTTRWSLVERWISNCVNSHPTCRQRRRSPSFLPTRLLHIPFGPMPPDPCYRLVDTRSQPLGWLGHSYLTLSHIWGTNFERRWETRLENLPDRLAVGVRREDLSLTFRDAVDVAARLQVPFLWIDSLCIVQNDDNDKQREISAMQNIYSNALINLSATSADNSNGGLTSSYEIHPRILWTYWGENGTPRRYRVIDLSFWRRRVMETAINFRGWVLQERVLAPRVLHFGFDQLLWECCDLAAAEEFPRGIPSTFFGSHPNFKQRASILLQSELDPSSGANDCLGVTAATYYRFHNMWQRLVELYGDSELTKPEDKLPAISGLARAIHKQLGGDVYIAGLWRRSLVSDLLWRVNSARRRIRGTTPDGPYEKTWDTAQQAVSYRAPSWSWASVDAELITSAFLDFSAPPMPLGDEVVCIGRQLAVILEAIAIPLIPDDPFGQIRGGRLVIYGQMHRLGADRTIYTPMAVLRATGNPVFDALDYPVAWDLYDEAYFFPLAIRRWHILPGKAKSDINIKAKKLVKNTDQEWDAKVERARAKGFAVNANGNWDTVEGLVICPIQDRTAFRRFGYMEMNIPDFLHLEAYAGAPEFHPEEASTASNQARFTADDAAAQGNVVTGVVEIV
ncbi:hypothetical protein DV736_g1521, partial [Chaetothyriales sp. CBS 134916]